MEPCRKENLSTNYSIDYLLMPNTSGHIEISWVYTTFTGTEIQRKLQSFINHCLRYICRIWWPRVISNENLWKETNQENVNIEIRRRKFRWIGHTL
jgi:hypothetical protein